MDLRMLLELKYPRGISISDCLGNEELKGFFPEGYLPNISTDLTSDKIPYLKVRETVNGRGEFYKVFNIYIRQNGHIANYPESEYVQLPLKLDRGFIARFTIPISSRVPNSIELAYFIPLISIPYRIVSDIRSDLEKSMILSSDTIIFDSLDTSTYPNITFDDLIVRWMDRREELYEFFTNQ